MCSGDFVPTNDFRVSSILSSSLHISRTSPFYFSSWIKSWILVYRLIWAFQGWYQCHFPTFCCEPKIALNANLHQFGDPLLLEWSEQFSPAFWLLFVDFGRSWWLWGNLHLDWFQNYYLDCDELHSILNRPPLKFCPFWLLLAFSVCKTTAWAHPLHQSTITIFIQLDV